MGILVSSQGITGRMGILVSSQGITGLDVELDS
jgi:hypothetical protein